MRRNVLSPVWIVALALSVASSIQALAQEPSSEAAVSSGPRFLLASNDRSAPVPIDISRTTVLRRRLTLDLNGASTKEALTAISAQSGIRIFYVDNLIAGAQPVRLLAEGITVAAALTDVLADLNIDVLFSPDGSATLVKRDRSTALMQTGSITGRVTNASTGLGVAGARVELEGTRLGTKTAENGDYRLAAIPAGTYTLAVRRVGYAKGGQALTLVADQSITVDVALEPIPTQLEKVVTTVTGLQRRVEMGNVISVINADSLVRAAPVSNLSELLTARVPGLQVFQSQGTVGGDAHIQIRGPNSLLLATEPIVIIDGVRYSTAAASRPFSGLAIEQVEQSSPLNDLNPNDIQTIEVVKGPSAATLYGTDAANGVIVVTTKHGQPGNARWNTYAKGTVMTVPPPHAEDLYIGWGTVFGQPDQTNCSLGVIARGYCTQQDSISVIRNPLNDPQYTIFHSAPGWNVGSNVSGGSQELRYYFSADLENALGPLRMPAPIVRQLEQFRGVSSLPDEQRNPNALNKASARANVAINPSAVLEFNLNAGYIHSTIRAFGVGGRSPYQGVYNTNDPKSPYGTGYWSPMASFAATSSDRLDRFIGSGTAQWRPASWISARGVLGLDLANTQHGILSPKGAIPADFYSDGYATDQRIRQMDATAELGITATASLSRLTLRSSIGAQYVRNLSDQISTLGAGLPVGANSATAGSYIQVAQSYSERVTLGSYFEELVGLNERLFLSVALRADGASAFGQNYKTTVYPKVGASWLISQEPFLPRIWGLDELRLRYAVGASGQQPQAQWAHPLFALQTYSCLAFPCITGVGLTAIGNPDLKPERASEHEFGFDATLLGSRLQTELTWYRRQTRDQIVSQALPPGFGSTYTNLGLTRGHGYEAQIIARVIDTRSVAWDVVMQHSTSETKLVSLGSAFPVYSTAGGFVEGYPLGARFMTPLVSYADANNDGIIDPSEVQIGDSAVYVGQSTPPTTQTLSTTIGLYDRRVRLSALLDRRTGFTQVDALKEVYCGGRCSAAVDRSTPLAVQAQTAVTGGGFGSTLPAEYWNTGPTYVERGDFTRLREVSAAFDLPVRPLGKFGARAATLTVSGRNLALWKKFGGPDPESAAVSGVSGGVAGGIPQARTWELRFDLGF